MTSHHTQDKQLCGITLESVLEKRRLDQALNAKEFAVCAGICYSTARRLFRLAGFPVIGGMVFWQDFVKWRSGHIGTASSPEQPSVSSAADKLGVAGLPPRAARILLEGG
eukprot:TRINITY_DN139_c0_g1_i6.p3 TRINITY_DN139_c0_g1~~TRINITY_DN139_c0_g1_i6.p3  ORF type:complete len:110 (+),score=22.52 TRINITY_DN139_c0_g1_i6:373-702(+)